MDDMQASKHTFVWCNGQGEVKEICGIGKVGLHCRREIQFRQIYVPRYSRRPFEDNILVYLSAHESGQHSSWVSSSLPHPRSFSCSRSTAEAFSLLRLSRYRFAILTLIMLVDDVWGVYGVGGC